MQFESAENKKNQINADNAKWRAAKTPPAIQAALKC